MGLGTTFVLDLMELKQRGALDGFSRVIEIGAQQLSNDMLRGPQALADLFALYNSSLPSFGPDMGQGDVLNGVENLPDDAPTSRIFWEALGFKYSALDFDGHRDSIAIDLNRDAVPGQLKGAFDLAVNTGTTEHVANQDNSFRVIHDLIRPGGIMMHEVPAQGMMTHGLFNYNLKFFWTLCRENGYEVLFLKIYSHPPSPIPDDIFLSNIQFSGAQHISLTEMPNFMIRAALRKRNRASFVTPLDIPTIIKSYGGFQYEFSRRIAGFFRRGR